MHSVELSTISKFQITSRDVSAVENRLRKKYGRLGWQNYVNLAPFYGMHGKGALIVGKYATGKTTLLWLLLYFFGSGNNPVGNHVREGELIIYKTKPRATEYLSLSRVAKVNVFYPAGEEFQILKDGKTSRTENGEKFTPWVNHENLRFIETDMLNDPASIFDKLEQYAVNVVALDNFVRNTEARVRWWMNLFREYLRWHPRYFETAGTWIIEEMRDLMPGHGKSVSTEHKHLSNELRDEFDAFRKENQRVIATTHKDTDFDSGFRDTAFPFRFYKKLEVTSVPEALRNYAPIFKRLEVDEIFIYDEDGNYGIRHSPIWAIPVNVPSYTSSLDEVVEDERSAAKRRILEANAKLRELGWTPHMRAMLFGYSSPTQIDRLDKRSINLEPEWTVDLEKLRKIEEKTGTELLPSKAESNMEESSE